MSTLLRWTKIPAEVLPRSSHSISVIQNSAYIFGGEIQPRQPCDNVVHKIGIQDGKYEEVPGSGDIPPPRVGHVAATVSNQIYVFGGRGGKAMTPLEEQGAVYNFDPSTSSWSLLKPTSSSFPQARSYHCATSTSTHLIIHGGCGGAASGSRFKDLWAFDVSSRAWTQLPDAPGDPRGGSAIAHAAGKIWRFGGYNGKTEVGGEIDVIELSLTSGSLSTAQWETRPFPKESVDGPAGPGSRSVCALLALEKSSKLVTFLGEGNPSPTGGHDAAGNFYADVWTYDPSNNRWDEVRVDRTGGNPGERGWFAATASDVGPVLWGGIDGNNDRLGDGYILCEA
ncbi:hypothetical protein BD324DRAFT_651210 [Kockovaella imperatae]|uniref:Galactose oxidase n=1 Tax=Kockovaella imperatae TaxID=4999 RepID=A0A1Y1UGU6_9TREE|nr:hypothetical protein BD324DRAFT_651210 [Kockovaella imperatae]ORX36726.1 hypothetical protein BD324DRAFT_651210 [Kockovaella imperatae]